MKTRNDFLYILNKMDWDNYLECNDDETYNYITKIIIDDFADSTLVRIKHILNILASFAHFFDNINSELSG